MLRNAQVLFLENFRKVQKFSKTYNCLNWSKCGTISKEQYERTKTPVDFIFVTKLEDFQELGEKV